MTPGTTKPSRPARQPVSYDLIQPGSAPVTRSVPIVVGVLADLSGSPEEPLPRLRDRRFVEITPTSFDTVLGSLRPRLTFTVPNRVTDDGTALSVELRFRSLADFEPTHVIGQVDVLRRLEDTRTRAAQLRDRLDPALAQLLMDVVRQMPELPGPSGPPDDLLEDLLSKGAWTASLHERPYLKESLRMFLVEARVAVADPATAISDQLARVIARVDSILCRQLDAILHAQEFQSLEATWRGLEFLVSRLPQSTTTKIKVLDVSRRELRRDLERAVEFDQSALFRMVYDDELAVLGGEPFALLAGDYAFDHRSEDLKMLTRLSYIAAGAAVPFVGAASPAFFGLKTFAELSTPRPLRLTFQSERYAPWRSFRASEDAAFVGLIVPRIVLRRRYGAETPGTSGFRYLEGVEDSPSGSLLGNAVYAYAARVVEAWERHGWTGSFIDDRSGAYIRGLPQASALSDEGEWVSSCSAEMAVTERRRGELEDLGFIPLCHDVETELPLFHDAVACGELPRPARPVSARPHGALLETRLAACRLAHYVKVFLRDKITTFETAMQCETSVNAWLAQLIGETDPFGQNGREVVPARAARVEVTHTPGLLGYRVALTVTPLVRASTQAHPVQLTISHAR